MEKACASMKYDFVRLLESLCKFSIPVKLGNIPEVTNICSLLAAFVDAV